jgi:hypothetical protein
VTYFFMTGYYNRLGIPTWQAVVWNPPDTRIFACSRLYDFIQ